MAIRTSDTGERLAIDQFKYAFFQRIALLRKKRLSLIGVHQRHAECVATIPQCTVDRKAYDSAAGCRSPRA
ncbi:MAG TPA: hypothetical protein VF852_04745 [Pseudolabrys sp.]